MGLALGLLAVAYREAQFIGVDVQPDPIAPSRSLAQDLRLSSLRFQEADVAAMQDDPSLPGADGRRHRGRFHDVAAAHRSPAALGTRTSAQRSRPTRGRYRATISSLGLASPQLCGALQPLPWNPRTIC
jgi:hypothetical protein